ncbi:fumarylacetoacetate hydrolase family protein [Streptomyces sp. SID10853]|uniref:fumarylacetoacetate hydrolase family protein n=1 Tax=Streptomyces sp. SID10853 TaxID=2706028 RepID=UPI0013C0181B|nr:fumarylacetoacetate hydrolase family protein [Streptomyces sp. SID10853]NDZ80927.1 fumarylacetoacetate hydrolase family protein [Streptomyces sp. SID10853]
MRYVSYFHLGTPHAGVLADGHVTPLRGVSELGRGTPVEVLAEPDLDEAGRVPLSEVRLRPVIPEPQKIICVGLNYRSHVTETERELPAYPVLFTKFPPSLIGADDPVLVPRESSQVDYEAELGIVIGRRARRVAGKDARSVIAGYTIANDVTMRDYQYKTHQWLQGKAWDACTPLGPALVSEDEIGDRIGKLAITLSLNGEVLQSSDTSMLIFDIPTLVSTVSEFTTLLPGDVILTGTPGGVGFRRDPQVFLTPGDRVSVSIDGLGELASTVQAETAR